MSGLTVTGPISSALTHFAMLGIAGILETDPLVRVRVLWTEEPEPRAHVVTHLAEDEIASRVRAHAERHAGRLSWIQRRIEGGARDGVGLFTARVKPPAADEWATYLADRAAARAEGDFDSLDERMQLALGEPAWWRVTSKDARPDDGASRWEMKTRNKGQEFLVHRLVPLAHVVADRRVEQVLGGLTGATCNDETGKNAAESRTATGLAQPGPTDSALAWCALWGLHVAPTVMRVGMVAQSAGVWPRHVVHPRWAVLPAFVEPVSVRRFSEVLASRYFDLAGPRAIGTEGDVVEASRRWLREQGVRALVRFSIRKTGSASAPERQILAGELDVL